MLHEEVASIRVLRKQENIMDDDANRNTEPVIRCLAGSNNPPFVAVFPKNILLMSRCRALFHSMVLSRHDETRFLV